MVNELFEAAFADIIGGDLVKLNSLCREINDNVNDWRKDCKNNNDGCENCGEGIAQSG